MLAAPRNGDQIGPYRLGEPLGAGGAGAVFATEGAHGEPLAIKIVRGEGLPEMLSRARREVEALGRIAHPNVLPLVDFGQDATQAWLVTPRIGGITLRRLLDDGPLLPETAALLVQLAAAGAGAIHDAGLVHRDLKPDNVMVTDDGRVVVIDLGLALAADWTRHTVEGSIAGSLPYMAPEQIDGRASPASDVWALCVTLWELASGRRPFARDRAQEEVAAILGGARPRFVEVERRVDPALAEIVESGLAAAPERRPRDGATLAVALYRWLGDALGGATTDAIARIRRDRAGWEAQVARHAAQRALGHAQTMIGDPFAAMRALDRGLAYVPDDPALTAAISAAVKAPVPVPVPVPVPDPVPVPTPVPPRRLGPWIALAAAILAVAAIVVVALLAPATRDRPATATAPDARPRLDRTDPESVVAAVIRAAETGDISELPSLCLPDEGDRDVHEVCSANPSDKDWPYFVAAFRGATVLGSRVIGSRAKVGVRLPNGDTEEIEMILQGRHWFLGQF